MLVQLGHLLVILLLNRFDARTRSRSGNLKEDACSILDIVKLSLLPLNIGGWPEPSLSSTVSSSSHANVLINSEEIEQLIMLVIL